MGRIALAVATWVILEVGLNAAGQVPVRIAMSDEMLAYTVTQAVRGAAARLERDKCQLVMRDFRDASGRRLEENLVTMQLTTTQYLSALRFEDGRLSGTCQAGVSAYTQRHSRTITICGGEKGRRLTGMEQMTLEVVIIHEVLHSLGLGENGPDPTSAQITRQVASRCSER